MIISWDCKSVCLCLNDDLAKFGIWVNHVATTHWQSPERSSVSFSIACLSEGHFPLFYPNSTNPSLYSLYHVIIWGFSHRRKSDPSNRNISALKWLSSVWIHSNSTLPSCCLRTSYPIFWNRSQHLYCSWSPIYWRHISVPWQNRLQSWSQSYSQ